MPEVGTFLTSFTVILHNISIWTFSYCGRQYGQSDFCDSTCVDPTARERRFGCTGNARSFGSFIRESAGKLEPAQPNGWICKRAKSLETSRLLPVFALSVPSFRSPLHVLNALEARGMYIHEACRIIDVSQRVSPNGMLDNKRGDIEVPGLTTSPPMLISTHACNISSIRRRSFYTESLRYDPEKGDQKKPLLAL